MGNIYYNLKDLDGSKYFKIKELINGEFVFMVDENNYPIERNKLEISEIINEYPDRKFIFIEV